MAHCIITISINSTSTNFHLISLITIRLVSNFLYFTMHQNCIAILELCYVILFSRTYSSLHEFISFSIQHTYCRWIVRNNYEGCSKQHFCLVELEVGHSYSSLLCICIGYAFDTTMFIFIRQIVNSIGLLLICAMINVYSDLELAEFFFIFE